MLGAQQIKAQSAAVVEVQAFMHRHGLELTDLSSIGGAELKSPNQKPREKARRVEKCWALKARLSVRHAHLEQAPAHIPTKPARRRRGEGLFLQTVENKELFDIEAAAVNGASEAGRALKARAAQ
jgi:hypothetical protein